MDFWHDFIRLALLLATGLFLLVAVLSAMLAWGLTHPPRLTAGAAAAHGWLIDPADAELEYDEWVLDRPGNVKLPVWDVPNPANPAGPIVIVSHCWGGSRYSSLQRLLFVFPVASRVILWDHRGHGEATGGISRLGTADVGDLIELMDRTAGADRKVILYGYSMGAGISICAAAEDCVSGRVIGVIADGPYRWTVEPVREALRVSGLPDWPITAIVARALCLVIPGLRGSERAQFAARLRCPLLVVHGTDDRVCPIVSAMEVAEAAPESELVIVPKGGHLDLHKTKMDRYRQTVEAFVRKCVKRSRGPLAVAGVSGFPGDARAESGEVAAPSFKSEAGGSGAATG